MNIIHDQMEVYMKQPMIGISPRLAINEKNGYTFMQINMDYLKQITQRNGIPLILTPGESFEAELMLCDGFLLIGGNDINPMYYHQTNDLGLSKEINDVEDKSDLRILQHAIHTKKPLLGICRGIQDMAAFLNGSLHQDIEYAGLSHPEHEKKHYVEKVNLGNLSKLLPDKFLVNSFHHQAVNQVPVDFIVTYKNGDVIEAIEHRTLPIFGVQWHPERFYTKESEIIFNYFWEKIYEYRNNHSNENHLSR